MSKNNPKPNCLNCDYAIEVKKFYFVILIFFGRKKSRSIKIFEKNHKGIFQNGYYFFAIYSESFMHSKIKYTFSEKNLVDASLNDDLFKRPRLLQRKSMIPYNTMRNLAELNSMDPIKIIHDMRNKFQVFKIKTTFFSD